METKLKSLIERYNCLKREEKEEGGSVTNRNSADKEVDLKVSRSNESSAVLSTIKWNSCVSNYDDKMFNNPNSLISLLNEILSSKQDAKLNNFLQVEKIFHTKPRYFT